MSALRPAQLFLEHGLLRRYTVITAEARRRPEVAADQFLSLRKGLLHFRATSSLRPRPTSVQLSAQVEKGVKLFLRAYGPP